MNLDADAFFISSRTKKECKVVAVDELPCGTADDYYDHVCKSGPFSISILRFSCRGLPTLSVHHNFEQFEYHD